MRFPVDHDLHCHSFLSLCSNDPAQTPGNMLAFAKAHCYTVQCVTDHLWDSLIPGPNGFYRPQDIAHVSRNLPLPGDDQVRMVFGCETEYCGNMKLGLHPSNFDKFGFIVIPPNHYHMSGLVHAEGYDIEEKRAGLLVERLEELTRMDLPWHKVGIAHMTCSLIFTAGDQYKVYELVDEKRFRSAMRAFARLGAGIELNLSCFAPEWREHEDAMLRLYRLAGEEGCRFYLASDAHHPEGMNVVPERAPEVIELLGLTKEDQFILP